MTFLERVDSLIARKKINRNTLSKNIEGLNHNSFYAWEKRGTIPSGDIISAIADYFQTTTDYLLGKTDNPSLPSQSPIQYDSAGNIATGGQGLDGVYFRFGQRAQENKMSEHDMDLFMEMYEKYRPKSE